MLPWLLACRSEVECPGAKVDGRCVATDDPALDDPSTGGTTTAAPGNAIDLDHFPPVVVSSAPAMGDLAVDPATTEISVRFSLPMLDGSWSWVQIDGDYPPGDHSAAYVEPDTNVLSGLELAPDTAYHVWLNDPYGYYSNFRGTNDEAALPWSLAFYTGDGADPGALSAYPPSVVHSVPAAGEAGVDPALDRIEVTFGKDMHVETLAFDPYSATTFPEVLDQGFADARTAYLEVALDPGTTYAVWVAPDDDPAFVDVDGNPAAPWLLTFRTAD